MNSNGAPTKQNIALIEEQIDADPYFSTLYEIESGRNPNAKNPESSAAGGFQFIKATAKALGLDNPYDLGQSFAAVKKLDAEHQGQFGNDPILRYAAHYLGAPVLKKMRSGATLDDQEKKQVAYLQQVVLPRFKAVYDAKTKSVET